MSGVWELTAAASIATAISTTAALTLHLCLHQAGAAGDPGREEIA